MLGRIELAVLVLVVAAGAEIMPQTRVDIDAGYAAAADGVRLFYRKVGRGKPIIFYLHGGPGSNFRGQEDHIEPLARGRTLIMYDQRGSGLSELVSDPGLLTATHHVRDLEKLRQHFGADRISIIGLSWGSGLAALYAATYPDRVERIVFVSPISPTREHFNQRVAHLDTLRTPGELAIRNAFREKLSGTSDGEVITLCREMQNTTFRLYFVDPTPEKLAHAARRCDIPPAAIRNALVVQTSTVASLGAWDLRPMLKKILVPTLVMEGDRSKVPLDATREFADALPNGRLMLIKDAGHEFFVDQPRAFQRAVGDFFSRRSRSRHRVSR